jgi:cytochrome c-type biogenesis protein CcmF
LIALIVCLYNLSALFVGVLFKNMRLIRSAQLGIFAQFGLVTVGVICLLSAILNNRFDVEYIYGYSNSELSTALKLTVFWAGQKGSLLLWTWVLSIYSVLVVISHRREKPNVFNGWVYFVLMVSSAFFLYMQSFTEPLFETWGYTPIDGNGLNPQLQNLGMIIHPPMLYLGFVGFVVPFAYCVASLITRRYDEEWINRTRYWTLSTWTLLTTAIVIGGWWAYHELGWGGFWAWDPVENASFMPWFASTAFLHTIMVQKRRDMFKAWNAILLTLTYFLVLYGTYLTRAGLEWLTSVHTFANTGLGPVFLVFAGINLVLGLGLVILRWNDLRTKEKLDNLLSREGLFLMGSFVLVGLLVVVWLGVHLPLYSTWMHEHIEPLVQKFSPGFQIAPGQEATREIYDRTSGPLFFLMILLIGLGPVVRWKGMSFDELIQRIWAPWLIGLGLAAGLVIYAKVSGNWPKVESNVWPLAALGMAFFAILTNSRDFWITSWRRTKRTGERLPGAAWLVMEQNFRRYGGFLAHVGLAILVIGVIGAYKHFRLPEDIDRPVRNFPQFGATQTLGEYKVTYRDFSEKDMPNYYTYVYTFDVERKGRHIGTIEPEIRKYDGWDHLVAEPAKVSNLADDLYLNINPPREEPGTHFQPDPTASPWVVMYLNPLVNWIWIGTGIIAFGGLTAMLGLRLSVNIGGRILGYGWAVHFFTHDKPWLAPICIVMTEAVLYAINIYAPRTTTGEMKTDSTDATGTVPA